MNYKEAKNKAVFRKVAGMLLVALSIISTAISFFKMVYYRLDDGTRLGGAISELFKNLVSWIYEQTQFLSFFWHFSPTPDHMNLKETHNLYFVLIYALIFIGFALHASGKKLSRRLSDIDRRIEDQLIEESIRGDSARTRQVIEQETNVPSNSIFSQTHQLYFAPIITGVIGVLIVKLLGL